MNKEQIKHNSPQSVISAFNPILTLDKDLRSKVNQEFVLPIIKHFAKGFAKGFDFLDSDLLKTELDFEREPNFVQDYIYECIVEYNSLIKDNWQYEGRVIHRPKCVVSFDESLTSKKSQKKYPYKLIFKEWNNKEVISNIHYGVIEIGEAPLLYIIRIELQPLILFIKSLKELSIPRKYMPVKERRFINDDLLSIKQKIDKLEGNENEIRELKRQERALRNRQNNPIVLLGERGELNINLSWNTTDDLDLHVYDSGGNHIYYSNKEVSYNGTIGKLDIDANAGTLTTTPQENIFWDKAPNGNYKVEVHLFSDRNNLPQIEFIIEIRQDGDEETGGGKRFSSYLSTAENKKVINITEFVISENNRLQFN